MGVAADPGRCDPINFDLSTGGVVVAVFAAAVLCPAGVRVALGAGLCGGVAVGCPAAGLFPVGAGVARAELTTGVVAAFVFGTLAAPFAAEEVAVLAGGFCFGGLDGGLTCISGLEAESEGVAGDADSALALAADLL
jgi:fluoride ion exporter CrcB/FEX